MEEMLPMKIINWDCKAAAFCFGCGFLCHFPSKNMVVIGNKFEKEKQDKTMVDVSNQHWNEDGSITVILNSIEEIEEFVVCVNIWNKMCEDEE